MSTIAELVPADERYARSFDRGHQQLPPRRHIAILTCADARILPGKAFGLEEGDAHIIGNAGGRARDALRSLVISQRLLDTTEVAVVRHTDGGMLTFTNRDLRAKVQENLGRDTGEFDFQPFQGLDASVREDVEFLVGSELLDPKTLIRGFVYDVTTGRLREVELEPAGHGSAATTGA